MGSFSSTLATLLPVSGPSNTLQNDENETQTILLQDCLHVPTCTVHLLCPRQIGATTGLDNDGFYATHANPTLVINGKTTTVKYDPTTNSPLLFTKPGIESYQQYLAHIANTAELPHGHREYINLTKLQCRKLYLHEYCAHESFDNINAWIQKGLFFGLDRTLAAVPDPKCTMCMFSKARRKSHMSNIGHIATGHSRPGQGVSSNGLEAAIPGRPFTTKGQLSNIRFHYASFWIDHASSFIYVAFHTSKAASKLIRSKTEFEQWMANYNVSLQNIRADNGVYAAQAFKESCNKRQQCLTYCAGLVPTGKTA